jgi:hypothetical protein
MAFSPAEGLETFVVADGSDGDQRVVVQAGYSDWGGREPGGKPAVQVTVHTMRDGRFDPISTSTVPVEYLGPMVSAATALLVRDSS